MGQKVNPHGLRVGVIKDWDSRWFAKDNVFGDTLVEDYNLRKTLKKQLYQAGIPAGGREHRLSVRAPHLLPPGHEGLHWPQHAPRRQGH